MIALLNELHEQGKLQILFRGGFISPKVFQYRDYYLHFHKETVLGRTRAQAIKNTADFFNISDRLVQQVVIKLQPNE